MNERLTKIHDEIHKLTDREITLIAVSKNHPKTKVIEAFKLGQRDFGENRVQELIAKYDVQYPINWHFIGALQTNKVKDVVKRCCLIHSVDRISLALEINKQSQKINKVMDILIQVNISLEDTKSGLLKDKVIPFINEVIKLENINICGLMTIGPNTDDVHEIRRVFKETKVLYDELKVYYQDKLNFKYLSMGMSSDYHIAISEGSNMIRVGTAIFGERDYSNNG